MREQFKTERRGDGETERENSSLQSPRLPVAQSRRFAVAPSPFSAERGWTLIELVITMTVMTILTLGVIPLVRTSIRREKEQRLHEALREMRNAIDEFHRDTVGMLCGPTAGVAGVAGVPNQAAVPNQPGVPNAPGSGYIDPRSRVRVADCTIFGVDNPDHYPPDLQTLVDGVDVVPRAGAVGAVAGAGLDSVGGSATQNSSVVPKKKIYLREIPIDPITGERDWCVLSTYDPPGEGCAGSPINVFDVRSKAKGEALNGEKYSDW
ncbi:MAG TPA: type II secretion system protein [Pyrinomonadaceae bacterium]|nr:type II secretion system protein [Pyrinomonadaceae bacterium]